MPVSLRPEDYTRIYLKVMRNTYEDIYEELNFLRRHPDTTDPQEEMIEIWLPQIAADYHRIDAQLRAFRRRQDLFKPPSEEQLEKVLALSTDVDNAINTGLQVTALLGLAQTGLQLANEINSTMTSAAA